MRLIVHVGANKTGSSAVQRFLALNITALRAEGIIVPDNEFRVAEKVPGYHVWGFAELLKNPPEGRRRLEEAVTGIEEAHTGASAILLSAENLAANPAAPSLFEGLVERYDVRVVMYIRRQDEYILSSWQQWYSKIQADFWAWVVSVVGELGDWRAYLQNWETVVPRERITVRLYERPKLEGGDVIADFHGLLGVSRPFDEFAYPQNTVNPSFSDAITELVSGNDLIFENVHDNDFYRFVEKMTGDRYVRDPRVSPITLRQRQAILSKYKAQNDWVRRNYFPHATGDLFTPPKEGDYHHVSREEMDREKLEFLTTLVYRMYKHGKR